MREPFDQIATVGEHVTLPCRVVNKQGVLQWTRDDFGLGSERDLIGFDRYAMTGSDEEGKKNTQTIPNQTFLLGSLPTTILGLVNLSGI